MQEVPPSPQVSIKNHYKNTEKHAWTLKKDGYCPERVVQFYPQIRVTSGTMLESSVKSVPYLVRSGGVMELFGIIRCTPQVSLSPADVNPKDKLFSS